VHSLRLAPSALATDAQTVAKKHKITSCILCAH
jgi:hypothetical protein